MFIVLKRRQIVAGVCAVVLVLVGGIGLTLAENTTPTAAGVGDWGLSFRQEGQPPVGNATVEALAAYDAYFLGDTGQKRLYITFDAGYENGYTPAILDALKKHNAPATFFVVGHYLESAPDLVRRMVAEGHTVGNHTYHHPDMPAIGDEGAFRRELAAVEDKYREITGQELPRLYRPPQGKYSPQNLAFAKAAGYSTFFWSLAYVDWQTDSQPSHQYAMDKLLPRTHNGAVVLLHSTSATNAEILDELLTEWEKMGFTFGTLTELSGA